MALRTELLPLKMLRPAPYNQKSNRMSRTLGCCVQLPSVYGMSEVICASLA